ESRRRRVSMITEAESGQRIEEFVAEVGKRSRIAAALLTECRLRLQDNMLRVMHENPEIADYLQPYWEHVTESVRLRLGPIGIEFVVQGSAEPTADESDADDDDQDSEPEDDSDSEGAAPDIAQPDSDEASSGADRAQNDNHQGATASGSNRGE